MKNNLSTIGSLSENQSNHLPSHSRELPNIGERIEAENIDVDGFPPLQLQFGAATGDVSAIVRLTLQ